MAHHDKLFDFTFVSLSSRKVQQLYYTELRQKVLQSQSRHQEAMFFQLAVSALQADIGDLDLSEWTDEREQRHYFLPEDYFPPWVRTVEGLPWIHHIQMCLIWWCSQLIKRRGRDFLLQHCPELHIEMRGVTRTQAMLQFIKQVSSLQDGAVTFYRMRQVSHAPEHCNCTGWNKKADCFCGQQINSILKRLLPELFHILLSVFSSFYMQEKKELRHSVLLGVAMKGVHIYQVEPPHMIGPHLEYLINKNLLCCF